MAAARKGNALLVARQTITVEHAGEEYPLLAGVTRLRADHAIAKAHRDLFHDAEIEAAEVDQATAAPGEKRGTRKRATPKAR